MSTKSHICQSSIWCQAGMLDSAKSNHDRWCLKPAFKMVPKASILDGAICQANQTNYDTITSNHQIGVSHIVTSYLGFFFPKVNSHIQNDRSSKEF